MSDEYKAGTLTMDMMKKALIARHQMDWQISVIMPVEYCSFALCDNCVDGGCIRPTCKIELPGMNCIDRKDNFDRVLKDFDDVAAKINGGTK